jgi:hypothetical protein
MDGQNLRSWYLQGKKNNRRMDGQHKFNFHRHICEQHD